MGAEAPATVLGRRWGPPYNEYARYWSGLPSAHRPPSAATERSSGLRRQRRVFSSKRELPATVSWRTHVVGRSHAALVSETASDVYELQVRVGRFLPSAVVLPLAFTRNFVVALVAEGTSSDTAVAQQWVLVTRQADGVARGSGPGRERVRRR